MRRKVWILGLFLALFFVWIIPGHYVLAAEPIILGVPTSLGFLVGMDGLE